MGYAREADTGKSQLGTELSMAEGREDVGGGMMGDGQT